MGDENSLREDISFLRHLAESGRKGPILGGIFLAASGVVFGLTCFVDWALRTGVVPNPGLSELIIWLGAGGVFTVFWIVMYLRMMTHEKQVPTATTAMFGTIWSACGAGVMVAFGTTVLISRQVHDDMILAGYVPVIFAFYGTAWFSCGALAKRGWMYLAGTASYVFAFLMALLTGNDAQSLAMGIGLLALLTLPGLKLVSDEARPKGQQ